MRRLLFSARKSRAFTLIELIVVMAIIVTLSVIGFISYNSYIRDARNTTRVSHLDEATAAIDRFVFNNGRAPKCRGNSAGANTNNVTIGAAVCYFVPDTGTGVPSSVKARGAHIPPAGVTGYLPCDNSPSTTHCTTPSTPQDVGVYGVDSADWTQLNLKSNPEDPRAKYYLYATDGGSAYAVFATKEETNGYSPIVRGYKAMVWDSTPPATTDAVKAALWPTTNNVTVLGWDTTGGTFSPSTTKALLGDGNVTTAGGATGPAPYSW